MNIDDLEALGQVFLDQLGEVEFSASSGSACNIVVNVDNTEVLNQRYYPDAEGHVVLDMRDLVRTRTYIPAPSGDDYQVLEESEVYITVNQDDESWGFLAFGFEQGLRARLSAVDYLRVPADFLMPVTLPVLANWLGKSHVVMQRTLMDHHRISRLANIDIADSDSYIVSCQLPVTALPAEMRNPFRIRYHADVSPAEPDLFSPIYEMVPGDFRQYLFLAPDGHYENIPMDGELVHGPTVEHVTAQLRQTNIKVSSRTTECYTQNSGWLTRQAADELCRLLRSDCIYTLEDGEWARIIIISSDISISSQDTLRSIRFGWTHAKRS